MDGQHILVAMVSAITGALSMVAVAYFRSKGEIINADSRRIQQMWDRIDQLEDELHSERESCMRMMEEQRQRHEREIESLKQEILSQNQIISTLVSRIGDISVVEEAV